MAFRLTVELPGNHSMRGYSECLLASEAFSLYRHLAGTRVRVVEILHLLDGDRKVITSAELEANAQSERLGKHSAARSGHRLDGP